eukprot:CAMPEP_0118957846 /NCGR_PEP_ID=MMETSP1169-20130426/62318_1 /TAXON_ID=36882 /ORGANISM="Pyramimonas obovata, Strain CCMP722" /LENGTH=49 /DNA_ID=CAMNT_0006905947 /DNA_START=67 /DNA_END=217 /DNA_ORIENTATION=+
MTLADIPKLPAALRGPFERQLLVAALGWQESDGLKLQGGPLLTPEVLAV